MGKPYKFVPFLKTLPFESKGKKLEKGKIEVEIKVLNALHLSKGSFDINSKNELYKEFMKVNNKYVIPGTSIKGMVRNIAEIVSHSCISVPNKERSFLPHYKKISCKKDHCIICNIFGAMGKRSKIKVSDFYYEEGTGKHTVKGMPLLRTPKFSNLYTDNDIIKGYKIYNHGIESILKNGTENCECFMKDSVFKGYILYEDLYMEELKLLCYSLGLSESFNHKLGYGKPAYYGAIKVSATESKFKEYAQEYEKTADSYKKALKVPDYEGLMY